MNVTIWRLRVKDSATGQTHEAYFSSSREVRERLSRFHAKAACRVSESYEQMDARARAGRTVASTVTRGLILDLLPLAHGLHAGLPREVMSLGKSDKECRFWSPDATLPTLKLDVAIMTLEYDNPKDHTVVRQLFTRESEGVLTCSDFIRDWIKGGIPFKVERNHEAELFGLDGSVLGLAEGEPVKIWSESKGKWLPFTGLSRFAKEAWLARGMTPKPKRVSKKKVGLEPIPNSEIEKGAGRFTRQSNVQWELAKSSLPGEPV